MGSQEKNEGKIEFDLERLAKKLTERASKTQSLFSEARIYRVPEDLRQVKEGAYTPRLIAIGPLHHGKEEFKKPMDDVKFYYTYYLLDRLAKGTRDEVIEKIRGKLKECATKVGECVKTAKKYYAEEVKFNDEEMAEMMLFDGCFILELLYASYVVKIKKEAEKRATKGGDSGNSKASSSSVPQPNNKGKSTTNGGDGGNSKASSSSVHPLINEVEQYNPIIDNILTAKNIKRDLLLLENQIPFFVLEELFKLTVDKIPDDKIPGGKKLSLTEYVISYFGDIMISPPDDENSGSQTKTGCSSPGHCVFWVRDYSKENEPKGKIQWEKREQYDHILHLLHDYYSPGDQWEDTRREDKKNSAKKFSALELDYGGVKFVPVEKKNLFDVEFRERKGLCWWFHGATFDIPTLIIHDHTEPFFRNLLAFEQLCSGPSGIPQYFTSYAKLMDVLINSEEDVQVLTNAKVIENYLDTDKDVFYLFNNLCKEIVTEDFYFSKECEQAFKFTKRNWWPRFIAYWKRTYFANPLGFITGFCLVCVAFGMQFAQSINDSLNKHQ